MSTAPFPTSAARAAARRGGAGPSPAQGLTVLVIGLLGSVLEGHSLARVTDTPLWVLGVIGGIWLVFPPLIVLTVWAMKARLAGASAPRPGPGVYLTGVLVVGGGTLLAQARQGSSFATAGRVTLTVAAGCAVLTVLAYGLRLMRTRADASLRQHGQQVTGTVTDDGLAEFRPGPNLKIATITVQFPDRQGHERWVQCRAVQAPGRPLAVGDAVSVWLDPATPDDLSRITVAADNGASRIVRTQRTAAR